MAFDGITVSAVVHELNEALVGGRIDKIYQPEKDEIVVSVRSKGQAYKLLATASSSHARLHLTTLSKGNPQEPPLFCMVMRKHLGGARIVEITQPDFERIVHIKVEGRNEMGDVCFKSLIIEIMGKHSNIILVGENGVIIDAVKHVSHNQSSVREVLPGRMYKDAPSQNKLNPLKLDCDELAAVVAQNSATMAQGIIYRNYTGISPLSASEIIHRAGVDASKRGEELTPDDVNAIYTKFKELIECVKMGSYKPEVVFDEVNKPFEFSCFTLTMYDSKNKRQFESTSDMLGYYYAEKDNFTRIGQKSQDLKKLVQMHIERCARKQEIQQKTMEETEGREQLRLYGELITANIYAIKGGMNSLTTANFYDESCPEITIPLNPTKSPSENAQAYFKKYNKQKRTAEALVAQMAQNEAELTYLEGVRNSLITSTDETDIAEIRLELEDQGFVKRRRRGKGESKPKESKPMQFISSDGYEIFVGKNNRQNDNLTLHFAMPDDIWLHTKNIPGSHVIVRTKAGEVSDTAILEAANLAAFFSKAREGSMVPVDYTPRRYVKKPSGSKPGFVIYETNKTAYITPDEAKVNSMDKL